MIRRFGVESRAHAHPGIRGGFAQACHGKKARWRWMQIGDRLVYHSPTTGRGGLVLDKGVLQRDMVGCSVPFGRRVRYAGARQISRAAIKNRFDLRLPPDWGMAQPRSHLVLSSHGFASAVGSIGATLLAGPS